MSCNIVFGSMSREDKGGFPLYFTQPNKLPGSNKRHGLREIGNNQVGKKFSGVLSIIFIEFHHFKKNRKNSIIVISEEKEKE